MKKSRLFWALLAALQLVSCRSLILEDRFLCPRFLFFDIGNGENFETYERLQVSVFNHPAGDLLGRDTTTVLAVMDREFHFAVRKELAVKGFGILGARREQLEGDYAWTIPLGQDSDPLFRFAFTAPTEEESFLVYTELVKDHARVNLRFLGWESYASAEGAFPFKIIVTGNTCGIDALSGEPLRGAFECVPEEQMQGQFSLILPRQADHTLRMEVYGKEGVYERTGLVDVFDLWDILRQQGGITWEEKNLPDLEVTVDYQEMQVNVGVIEWQEQPLDYNF